MEDKSNEYNLYVVFIKNRILFLVFLLILTISCGGGDPDSGAPVVFDWIEDRFAGIPAPSNCDEIPEP